MLSPSGATITNCTINIGFPTATQTQNFTTMSAAPNDTQPQMKRFTIHTYLHSNRQIYQINVLLLRFNKKPKNIKLA